MLNLKSGMYQQACSSSSNSCGSISKLVVGSSILYICHVHPTCCPCYLLLVHVIISFLYNILVVIVLVFFASAGCSIKNVGKYAL